MKRAIPIGLVVVVAAVGIFFLVRGGKESAAESAATAVESAQAAAESAEAAVESAQDVAGTRFQKIKGAEQKEMIKKLADAGAVQVLEVKKVVSAVEMQLKDDRALCLAYVREPADKKQRKEAEKLVKQLCKEFNYVVTVPSRTDADAYARNVPEDSAERLTAIVSVHTGDSVIADLGMHLLENGLAEIDPTSRYADNPLYKAAAERAAASAPK
jgi:hypothetical protein